MLENRPYCSAKADGIFWFRVFGFGLVIKDTRKHRPYFSERNGLVYWMKLGNWRVRWLTPVKMSGEANE